MAPDQVPPNNFPNTLANCAIRQYARGMTTTPESQRDELARTLMDASSQAMVKNGSRHWPNMADTVLAAGYRKARTVTTIEELGALPDGSFIETEQGGYWQADKRGHGEIWWREPGNPHSSLSEDLTLPAIVRWEPEA